MRREKPRSCRVNSAARWPAASASARKASAGAGGQLLLYEGKVPEDSCQQIVEVLRDASRQLPDRFHFLRFADLILKVPAVRNVPKNAHDALDSVVPEKGRFHHLHRAELAGQQGGFVRLEPNAVAENTAVVRPELFSQAARIKRKVILAQEVFPFDVQCPAKRLIGLHET